MNNPNPPVHAQFTKGHIALILSCALLLATFLAVTGINPFSKKNIQVSNNNQQPAFYNNLYSASVQAVSSKEQGQVAGAEIAVPRGPIMPRGNP